jgi:hypothetical protein
VIGASKCGTTALYFYLSRHPDIFLPPKKELHYHSYASLAKNIGGPGDKYIINNICKTEKEYLNHYSNAQNQKAIIDISPSYLYFPESAQSIKEMCGPDTKIICLVKHPVGKFISQYNHLLSEGRETLNFSDALLMESKRKADYYSDMWLYRESGYMSDKIQAFKDVFKHVYVINSDDLMTNLKVTLHGIFNYIGVSADEYIDYSTVNSNFSGMPKFKLISKTFIQPNLFTNFLRKVIPQKAGRFFREKINNFNKGNKFTVSPALFNDLEKEYLEEIDSLNNILRESSLNGSKIKFN